MVSVSDNGSQHYQNYTEPAKQVSIDFAENVYFYHILVQSLYALFLMLLKTCADCESNTVKKLFYGD